MTPSDPQLISDLCSRLVDETLTPDEQRLLEEMLEQSEDARREYVRYMDLSASLTHYAPLLTPAVLPLPTRRPIPARASHPSPKRPAPTSFSRPRIWSLAAAAALTLAFTGFWFAHYHNRPSVEIEVIASSDSSFSPGRNTIRKPVTLKDGTLSFRMPSGAVVDVVGPARFELLNPMTMRLLSGSATTDVGEFAKGFSVLTGSAKVVDLGTRFGVSVNDSGETGVVVFEGEVEIHQPSDQSSTPPIADLNAGEALKINSTQTTSRLSSVVLRDDPRTVLSSPNHQSSVVSSVTDNSPNSNDRRYYTIIPGGMKQGARPYVAAFKPTWQPLPGSTFPEELLGADLIGTFGADRRGISREIQLTLSAPCTVYVILDERTRPATWLAHDFTRTGLRLRSGPWGEDSAVATRLQPDNDGRYFVTYNVWARQVTTPGTITLGPPRHKDEPSQYAMYGIAVKVEP